VRSMGVVVGRLVRSASATAVLGQDEPLEPSSMSKDCSQKCSTLASIPACTSPDCLPVCTPWMCFERAR
jgi:hypothetical protein